MVEKLGKARDPIGHFNTIEPFFQMKAEPRAGENFMVTVRTSAYGVVPSYYVVDSEVHLDIPVDEASI